MNCLSRSCCDAVYLTGIDTVFLLTVFTGSSLLDELDI